MKEPFLSVIIPAYNELANFKKQALESVASYLSGKKFSWEVLIVDDGSTDGSPTLIKDFCQKHNGFYLIQNKHMGKAGTVARGVTEAKGNYLLFTDFDQATPIEEWEKLLPYLKNGSEVVIGSREVAGSKREKEPWYRHMMGKGFNFGVKLLAVGGIADTQCGFKAFEAKSAKKLFSKLQVYKPREIDHAFTGAFDVELLFIARKMGLRIAEVPIHWKHVETNRVSPLRDSLHMAFDVVKIRLYAWMGRYS
ncbi:glycosyltransferase family 2 protein [Candidatus Beckwithbacteria bacterium]|nr:glycosyltransferase family 2 protein [Candidatus Beckwithbacteria bacterium]